MSYESPLDKVLRPHQEMARVFEDREIHAFLTDRSEEYLEFVLRGLTDIAQGRIRIELPAKQIFDDPATGGDFRIMPCILRSPLGVRKTVKIVGTNVQQRLIPDQITVGKAFAMHPTENFISHVFAACLLSSARTGICAAAGVRLLGSRPQSLALIGAGRVSYYAAYYLTRLNPVETLHVCDCRPERAEALASLLRQQASDTRVIVGRPEHAVDLVVIATTSEVPVYGPEDAYADTVVSLGADTHWQHELHVDLADNAGLYVDTLDSVRYGDLREWIAKGRVMRQDLTDLLSLAKKEESKPPGKRRLFISTGSALLDNLTIGYLLSRSSGDTLYG